MTRNFTCWRPIADAICEALRSWGMQGAFLRNAGLDISHCPGVLCSPTWAPACSGSTWSNFYGRWQHPPPASPSRTHASHTPYSTSHPGNREGDVKQSWESTLVSYTRVSHTSQYIASWKQRGGCETVMGIYTCVIHTGLTHLTVHRILETETGMWNSHGNLHLSHTHASHTPYSTLHPGNRDRDVKQSWESTLVSYTCISHTLQYIASWKQIQGCETVMGIYTCLIHTLLTHLQHTL